MTPLLLFAPIEISYPVTVNVLLVRGLVAPLGRLTETMRSVEPLEPGRRLVIPGSDAEVHALTSEAVRHADASKVLLDVRQVDGGGVRLIVRDDGRRLPPDVGHGGDGIAGMRERRMWALAWPRRATARRQWSSHILEKLGMRDRVELTRYAIRRGLVEP